MSDCSPRAWKFRRTWGDTEWRQPEPRPRPQAHPVAKLHADFDDGKDWDYPIALNGRTMLRFDMTLPDGHPQVDLRINGARQISAPTRDFDEWEVD